MGFGLRIWVLGLGFGWFWVQDVGVLGLVLKVLCLGLRFFGVWAWGLGFGYRKKVFVAWGLGLGLWFFAKNKQFHERIFKNLRKVYTKLVASDGSLSQKIEVRLKNGGCLCKLLGVLSSKPVIF